MQPEIQKRLFKLTRKKIAIISLISFILLMLAITAQAAYVILHDEKVYDGVYINNVYVGGLTIVEMNKLLEENLKHKTGDLELTLKCKNSSEKISYKDLDVSYDLEAAADKAYAIGRQGNVFARLGEIFSARANKVQLEVPVLYNQKAVDNAVQSLYDKTLIKVKEADLLIQNDRVAIRSGHHGESIDKSKTLSDVEEYIINCEGGSIEVPVIETPPSKINVEKFYDRINQEPKDAYATVEKNEVKIIPPVIGREIIKSDIAKIADQLENTENTERVLPVKFTHPERTSEEVSAQLFKDTLKTFSTWFDTSSTNNANRGTNIRIAVSKINGKVIGPGQTFSFNQVVGPRTAEGGYKEAHTYVGGEIVDGIGGGICQVSTTLYNAVLFADLEVVERSNHTFTVGYVDKGRDAAVSYGGKDLKFRNNTKWPIRIYGTVTSGNQIVFKLVGTNETPGKEVIVYRKDVKSIPAPTVYINDPTMKQGQTRIKTYGMPGLVVDTYKTVKIDGKVVSDKKIHTSSYIPHRQEVLRGTKKVASSN